MKEALNITLNNDFLRNAGLLPIKPFNQEIGNKIIRYYMEHIGRNSLDSMTNQEYAKMWFLIAEYRTLYGDE